MGEKTVEEEEEVESDEIDGTCCSLDDPVVFIVLQQLNNWS